MRVVVLIAHANAKGQSTAHRLAAAAESALLEDGHEVRVFDLVHCGFDRVATVADFTLVARPEHFDYETSHVPSNDNLISLIREQQAQVLWSTHVVVIGPIWFYRYPATFYAYTERVLNSHFGYTAEDFAKSGPLRGRKVMCVATFGGFASTYTPDGPQTTVENILYHVTRGHFGYCGMTCLRSQAFYECTQDASPCDAPAVLEKWKRAVKNLDRRPVIPFLDAAVGLRNEGHIMSDLADLSLDAAIAA
jgi:putative NADPH-quinone reductase